MHKHQPINVENVVFCRCMKLLKLSVQGILKFFRRSRIDFKTLVKDQSSHQSLGQNTTVSLSTALP